MEPTRANQPYRRFGLGDGLILLAALALTLFVLRETGWFARLPNRVASWWETSLELARFRSWKFPATTRGQAASWLAVEVVDEILGNTPNSDSRDDSEGKDLKGRIIAGTSDRTHPGMDGKRRLHRLPLGSWGPRRFHVFFTDVKIPAVSIGPEQSVRENGFCREPDVGGRSGSGPCPKLPLSTYVD